ncbi:PPOX class F420-dependent oxidoreductase [Amycolatopsis sp.]|uniref:pyridoxamine 5'-phosphate oxidase family protein n=1 Tax=Amycolatopsis sp. TaxID=37632 RepID=UPI002D7FD17F|nr:PPOX class F420-dependent oxidoreductase [Amycolatopsis sp.]HET6708586.1 PPOX class F420-dependent oxidoreductase [Amycolatopsis sp.]
MSAAEVSGFLREQRVATLATLGPSGQPHLVAMWYAVLDGVLWFETKAKSQKAANLRRDGRVTVLVETGDTYDALRGVALEGRATIVDDLDALWAVGVDLWERYHGPYSEEVRPMVEFMLTKRVAVRLDVERTRSWDHRKLGLPAMPLGGTTATTVDVSPSRDRGNTDPE